MTTEHGYAYLAPSSLSGRDLRRPASGGRTTSAGPVAPLVPPRFFAGFLTTPEAAAVGLLGCGGAYARLDVLPAGLDGDIVDHGTTNVDINAPLREALARVDGHLTGTCPWWGKYRGGLKPRCPGPRRHRTLGAMFATAFRLPAGCDPRAAAVRARLAGLDS